MLNKSADLPISPEVQAWIAEKKRWIETPLTCDNGAARHQAIERCNRALQPFAHCLAAAAEAERRQLVASLHADTILAARDYAFCLFPEDLLAEFLLDTVGRSL